MHKSWNFKGVFVAVLAGAVIGLGAGTANAQCSACGNVDDDGSGNVLINDCTLVLRYANALESADDLCGGDGPGGNPCSVKDCGDLNASGGSSPADGDVNSADVVTCLRFVSGIEGIFGLCDGPPEDDICGAGAGGSASLPRVISSNTRVDSTCDCTIDGTTFIQDGAVLTFDAGATCEALLEGETSNPQTPSVLIFQPGSKIDARGTQASPVTLTSAGAGQAGAGSRGLQDWGGVVILGRAPINVPGGVDFVEGLAPSPETSFGGNEANDLNGQIRFTRIQFSGIEFSPDNELNVFVCAACGRGTSIDFLHAHAGLDDCIEWFGGSVNSKHLIASACGDDGFDSQLGTTGAVQYAFMAQDRNALASGGSNGIESDNNENGFDFGPPRTTMHYCNMTLCGEAEQGGGVIDNDQRGMLMRRGTSLHVANTIVANFERAAINMRDDGTMARACTNSTTLAGPGDVDDGNNLVVEHSIFWNNDNDGGSLEVGQCEDRDGTTSPCTATEVCPLWEASQDLERITPPGDTNPLPGSCPFPPSGYIPAGGSLPDTHPFIACSSIDPFFDDDGDYIGAFEPGSTEGVFPGDWTAGWSDYPSN